MIGVIKGTGSYVPNQIVDNAQLSRMVETSNQWIVERTGVSRRHIREKETTSDMAVEAARRAMEDAKINADEVDMILVATISSDVIMPNTACVVQEKIGASGAVCFDLNAACSGFLFAYNTIQMYMASNMVKCALVVGSESLSNLTNWSDRGTCILFGDGAGAVVLKAEEGVQYPIVMHSDGSKGQALTCGIESQGYPEVGIKSGSISYMEMEGQSVFRFAVRQVPISIEELLVKLELNIEEIDYFILHQANRRIVESVAKRLKVDIAKFPMNLEEYGNTSSASIPLLLDELNKKNRLKSGMKIILAGFGGGLTWGASYLEWS